MKRNNKVSINLTQEQYDLLKALANLERRSVSELAALIVIDNSQALFLKRQEKGKMTQARFIATQFDDRQNDH